MNFDRIDQHFIRLLVIALVVHVYRDWELYGQVGVPLLAFGIAVYSEWIRTREARSR